MHFISKSLVSPDEDCFFCISSSNDSLPKKLSTVQITQKYACLLEEFVWRRSLILPIARSTLEPTKKLSIYSESSISNLLRDKDLTGALKSILVLAREGYCITIPMITELFTVSFDVKSAEWSYFVELCRSFPSLLSEWLLKDDLPVAFTGKEDFSSLFTIGYKTKRKTNFLFLLNKFLQSKSNNWLFFVIMDWIKTTAIVRIDQSETLKAKFESFFRLFGFDFFFANPYEFEPLFKILFEAAQTADSNCAWKESIVILLKLIVEVLISFSVHHQFSTVDTLAFHFFVQFKELSDATMEWILKHVLSSFPTVRVLVIWHLAQKRFRTPSVLKLKAVSDFNWSIILPWILRLGLAERPKKSAEPTVLEADLSFLRRLQQLVVDSCIQMHTFDSELHFTKEEYAEISQFLPELPSSKYTLIIS